jgi:hypothetical protein
MKAGLPFRGKPANELFNIVKMINSGLPYGKKW